MRLRLDNGVFGVLYAIILGFVYGIVMPMEQMSEARASASIQYKIQSRFIFIFACIFLLCNQV